MSDSHSAPITTLWRTWAEIEAMLGKALRLCRADRRALMRELRRIEAIEEGAPGQWRLRDPEELRAPVKRAARVRVPRGKGAARMHAHPAGSGRIDTSDGDGGGAA